MYPSREVSEYVQPGDGGEDEYFTAPGESERETLSSIGSEICINFHKHPLSRRTDKESTYIKCSFSEVRRECRYTKHQSIFMDSWRCEICNYNICTDCMVVLKREWENIECKRGSLVISVSPLHPEHYLFRSWTSSHSCSNSLCEKMSAPGSSGRPTRSTTWKCLNMSSEHSYEICSKCMESMSITPDLADPRMMIFGSPLPHFVLFRMHPHTLICRVGSEEKECCVASFLGWRGCAGGKVWECAPCRYTMCERCFQRLYIAWGVEKARNRWYSGEGEATHGDTKLVLSTLHPHYLALGRDNRGIPCGGMPHTKCPHQWSRELMGNEVWKCLSGCKFILGAECIPKGNDQGRGIQSQVEYPKYMSCPWHPHLLHKEYVRWYPYYYVREAGADWNCDLADLLGLCKGSNAKMGNWASWRCHQCESDFCDECIPILYQDWMHMVNTGQWKGTYFRKVTQHSHLLISDLHPQLQNDDEEEEEESEEEEEEEEEDDDKEGEDAREKKEEDITALEKSPNECEDHVTESNRLFKCLHPKCEYSICGECAEKDIAPLREGSEIKLKKGMGVFPFHPHTLIRIVQTDNLWKCDGRRKLNIEECPQARTGMGLHGVVYRCPDCNLDICEGCMYILLEDMHAAAANPPGVLSKYIRHSLTHPHSLFYIKGTKYCSNPNCMHFGEPIISAYSCLFSECDYSLCGDCALLTYAPFSAQALSGLLPELEIPHKMRDICIFPFRTLERQRSEKEWMCNIGMVGGECRYGEKEIHEGVWHWALSPEEQEKRTGLHICSDCMQAVRRDILAFRVGDSSLHSTSLFKSESHSHYLLKVLDNTQNNSCSSPQCTGHPLYKCLMGCKFALCDSCYQSSRSFPLPQGSAYANSTIPENLQVWWHGERGKGVETEKHILRRKQITTQGLKWFACSICASHHLHGYGSAQAYAVCAWSCTHPHCKQRYIVCGDCLEVLTKEWVNFVVQEPSFYIKQMALHPHYMAPYRGTGEWVCQAQIPNGLCLLSGGGHSGNLPPYKCLSGCNYLVCNSCMAAAELNFKGKSLPLQQLIAKFTGSVPVFNENLPEDISAFFHRHQLQRIIYRGRWNCDIGGILGTCINWEEGEREMVSWSCPFCHWHCCSDCMHILYPHSERAKEGLPNELIAKSTLTQRYLIRSLREGEWMCENSDRKGSCASGLSGSSLHVGVPRWSATFGSPFNLCGGCLDRTSHHVPVPIHFSLPSLHKHTLIRRMPNDGWSCSIGALRGICMREGDPGRRTHGSFTWRCNECSFDVCDLCVGIIYNSHRADAQKPPSFLDKTLVSTVAHTLLNVTLTEGEKALVKELKITSRSHCMQALQKGNWTVLCSLPTHIQHNPLYACLRTDCSFLSCAHCLGNHRLPHKTSFFAYSLYFLLIGIIIIIITQTLITLL